MNRKLVEFAASQLERFSGGAAKLSGRAWLQKHPTTPTKPSKKEANPPTWLGNDILKAAERPIVIDEPALLP